MTYFTHVVDFAVNDFAAAAEGVTLLTGVEGISMWEDYGADEIDGIHFPVRGLPTFGVMSPRENVTGPVADMLRSVLKEQGEGAVLLGFAVKNLERVMRDLRQRGISYDPPRRVGDEDLIHTERVGGVAAVFCEHDDGHWERWYNQELREETKKVPEVRTRHRVRRAEAIEYAVDDVEPTVEAFSAMLGESPVPITLGSDGGAVVGFEFPLVGLQALRVFGVEGQPDTPRAARLRRSVESRGDRLATMTFIVDSADATQSELESHGVAFEESKPTRENDRITCATLPQFGLTFEYVEVCP